MMRLILPVQLLLVCVSGSPYVLTTYYEVVKSTNDPRSTRTRYTGPVEVKTTTQYVTPTVSANPLTAVTSVKDHLFTHVDIELPEGAGLPITQSIPSTSYGVAITYYRCTSSTTAGESAVAIPPYTGTAFLSLPTHMPALSTPLTSYMSTLSVNENLTSSFPVVILRPMDIDPVELAAASAGIQPHSCLAATTSVNYHNACEFGPSSRMERPPTDISCGEHNPCCFDCRGQTLMCIRNCDNWDDRPFRKCADGRTYYLDETSIDPMYTMDPPQETQGEWTGEQRENDGNVIRNTATAAARVKWIVTGGVTSVAILLRL